jgi:uncharacterized repeat protein (TIGR01451 family)
MKAANSRNLRTIPFVMILFFVSFSAQAQQWERVVGDKSPGIRITDEKPLCWFSVSRYSPQYHIQLQSELSVTILVSGITYDAEGRVIEYSETVTGEDSQLPLTIYVSDIKYNSFGFIIEYYASVTGNEYSIEIHIYDVTYNSHGQTTGFKELRTYRTSGNTYNIEVSNVTYDVSGRVKDGYNVTVLHDSQPVSPVYKDISNYINLIVIGQIWDYGDPTDSTDLTYVFYLYIEAYMDVDVNSIEVLTPAGYTFQIPKQAGKWSDGIWTSYETTECEYERDFWIMVAIWEYAARFKDLSDLKAYGDGEYTIIVHYNSGDKSQTTVRFVIPDTNEPIPQPTQEWVLKSPLQQTIESPVTFYWEPFTDQNVEDIDIEMEELGTARYKWDFLDVNETSWGPVYMPDGIWEARIFFNQDIYNINSDGIGTSLFKSSYSNYKFILEGCPWTMYEVWGGNTWMESGDGHYDSIADLEANGYVKLGGSDGQTATFSGQYQYYVIATVGEFLLNSIQGSDGSYYSKFEANCRKSNIYNEDYMLGPKDGQCAVVGGDCAWYDRDYSGYFAFTNPGNWEELTIFTSNLNLNISKDIENSAEELDYIDPNDTITYIINIDSNDFTNDVTDVTIVDILPDEMSFVSADSNEVLGKYDIYTHTFTWLCPSLEPESAIEMHLTVKINPDVVPGTTITNFVTIDSNETPPTTASVDVFVCDAEPEPFEPLEVCIAPQVIGPRSVNEQVLVVIALPDGVDPNDVDQLIMYPGEIIADYQEPDPGICSKVCIRGYFDKMDILNSATHYGEVTLTVEVKLKTGQEFSAKTTAHLTRVGPFIWRWSNDCCP